MYLPSYVRNKIMYYGGPPISLFFGHNMDGSTGRSLGYKLVGFHDIGRKLNIAVINCCYGSSQMTDARTITFQQFIGTKVRNVIAYLIKYNI